MPCLVTSCRLVGLGGCRSADGIILSYNVSDNVSRSSCHQLCSAQVSCTGVEYFPYISRCQFQNFSINHSAGVGPVECFDCTFTTIGHANTTSTPNALNTTSTTRNFDTTSIPVVSVPRTTTLNETTTRSTTYSSTICNVSVSALPIEDIGPLSGRPGDAILFQLSGGRKRRSASLITCVFHYSGDIFNYACSVDNQCYIPTDAPKSVFYLTFCNQLDCESADTGSLQNCIENTYPRTDYAISYTTHTEKNTVLPQEGIDVVTWSYIGLMFVGLFVVTLITLPRWRKMTRSKNQWSNMFVYSAKIGVIIYALADPRQGKILSSTAFVSILGNIHDIMETWWEFRRDPSSLYLHVNDNSILTNNEISLKEKFGRVTERLAYISYGILLSSIIGLMISHQVDGQCSVLAVEECSDVECESNAGELWFMWVGFFCVLAEIVVEDDIYKIEIEHSSVFDQSIVDMRTRLKKIRQRIYAGSLFLACVLGSSIGVEVHEFMSNTIIVAMVGFQRWIKIQVTNALTQNLKKQRLSIRSTTL